MRFVHLATLTAATACIDADPMHETTPQQEISGLGFLEGSVQVGPGPGSGTQPTPGIILPGDRDEDPVALIPGPYVEVIQAVLEAHPDRSDLEDGAERTVTVDEARGGWLMEGFITMEDIDGRLSGGGYQMESDPEVDCVAELVVQIEGSIVDEETFRVFVSEQVFVGGKGCADSELGPQRMEENVYRARLTAEE